MPRMQRSATGRAIMRRLPRPLPTNPKMVAASADRLGTAMDVFGVWLDNRRGSLRKQVHNCFDMNLMLY
jgi:hypothetical protein